MAIRLDSGCSYSSAPSASLRSYKTSITYTAKPHLQAPYISLTAATAIGQTNRGMQQIRRTKRHSQLQQMSWRLGLRIFALMIGGRIVVALIFARIDLCLYGRGAGRAAAAATGFF